MPRQQPLHLGPPSAGPALGGHLRPRTQRRLQGQGMRVALGGTIRQEADGGGDAEAEPRQVPDFLGEGDLGGVVVHEEVAAAVAVPPDEEDLLLPEAVALGGGLRAGGVLLLDGLDPLPVGVL